MKIFHDISTFKKWADGNKISITIGNFDGIHLGHKDLLDEYQSLSIDKELEPVIVTFDPHPALFFAPDKRLLLNSYEKKIKVLGELGFKYLLVLKFNDELQKLSAKDFLLEYIIDIPTLEMVYTGYDFALGKSKEGGVQLVKDLAPNSVYIIEGSKFLIDGEKLSSSFIRELLLSGEIKKSNRLLVSSHSIEGVIEDGNHKGREFGFPTANLKLNKNVLIPCSGVYAGSVEIDNTEYRCAINIGTRPSVTNDTEVTVEAHIIGFDEDLYGKSITLILLDRLRDEKKFDSKEELIEQITSDIQSIKAMDV